MDLSFIRRNKTDDTKAKAASENENPKRSFFQRSLTDNTLKFFGSVSEKKNGLWNNLSSKFDSVTSVVPGMKDEEKRGTPEGSSSPEKSARRLSQPTVSETDKLFANSQMSQSMIINGHTKMDKPQRPQTPPQRTHSVKVDVHPTPNESQNDHGRIKISPDVKINFDTPLYSNDSDNEAPKDKTRFSPPTDFKPKPSLHRRGSLTAEEVFLDNLEKKQGQLLCVDDRDAKTNLASPNRTMKEFQFGTADGDDSDELFLVPVPSDSNLMDFEAKTEDDIGTYESIRDDSACDDDDDDHIVMERQDSDDSSEEEFGGIVLERSESQNSEHSWADLDEESAACRNFMEKFVDAVFSREAITQEEKALFGQYCQQAAGRLWFARAINSKRVENKNVDEEIFYQLVQHFALVLFECNEADDFSPAKTLMNMCFTFYYETIQPSGVSYKHFLYSYLKEQPIWSSLRFWNAAFFDAVQVERSRRPVSTNRDDTSEKQDDRTFQENVIFGQLGTFSCNMRAFGLSKELVLEFLRKQSTIGNLKEEQIQMLRENVERWSE